MVQDVKKKPFNKRAFISIAMFITGLSLPFSGLMNHKLQFEQLTMKRHFWMSVHNSAAILFTIFAIIHILYNRRIFINYVKKIKGTYISKEALAALAMVTVLIGLITSHVFKVR